MSLKIRHKLTTGTPKSNFIECDQWAGSFSLTVSCTLHKPSILVIQKKSVNFKVCYVWNMGHWKCLFVEKHVLVRWLQTLGYFCSCAKHICRKEAHKPKHTITILKHGSGSIMVWGGFSSERRSEYIDGECR